MTLATEPERRVLALDPALNNFGYCLPNGSCSTFKPPTKDRYTRLCYHYTRLCQTIEATEPHFVVMEGPSYGSTKFAHTTVQLGELRGIVILAVTLHHLPLIELAPKSVKKFATNNGNANKDGMVDSAMAADVTLIADDNQADAFWMRQMALMRYGQADVPAYDFRYAAIGGIEWPA